MKNVFVKPRIARFLNKFIENRDVIIYAPYNRYTTEKLTANMNRCAKVRYFEVVKPKYRDIQKGMKRPWFVFDAEFRNGIVLRAVRGGSGMSFYIIPIKKNTFARKVLMLIGAKWYRRLFGKEKLREAQDRRGGWIHFR